MRVFFLEEQKAGLKAEGEIQMTDTCWTGSTGRQGAHTSQPDMSHSVQSSIQTFSLIHTHTPTHHIAHSANTISTNTYPYAHQAHHSTLFSANTNLTVLPVISV